MLKFFAEKMCVAWYFIRILYIESTKTVNEMTLNELVKLMTLWTTGPRKIEQAELVENLPPFTYPTDFCLTCIHFYFGKIWFFKNQWLSYNNLIFD